jgi:hypothetical protein
MDAWDLVLWIVVSYVAVMSLVRLMLTRRDRLLKDLQKQLDQQLRQGQQGGRDSRGNRAA